MIFKFPVCVHAYAHCEGQSRLSILEIKVSGQAWAVLMWTQQSSLSAGDHKQAPHRQSLSPQSQYYMCLPAEPAHQLGFTRKVKLNTKTNKQKYP